MKKEMKFSELPEKVQGFLRREYVTRFEAVIDMNWLHNKADWTKATNDERLAYAEFMYSVGTNFIDLNDIEKTSDRKPYVAFEGFDIIVVKELGRGGAIYNHGKWAQIIATPEEIDRLGELGKIGSHAGEKLRESLTNNKPIFKVGDRPEWTVDLIQKLPHGTELKCAVDGRFKYDGQGVLFDSCGDLFIFDELKEAFFFTYKTRNRFAKILSLPESYLNPVKPEEEFKAGEIVEARDHSGWYKFPVKYLGVKNSIGMFACEFIETGFNTNNIGVWNEIRKIDPDKHLKDLADEIINKHMLVPVFNDKIQSMLIEMGKKVQDKIK